MSLEQVDSSPAVTSTLNHDEMLMSNAPSYMSNRMDKREKYLTASNQNSKENFPKVQAPKTIRIGNGSRKPSVVKVPILKLEDSTRNKTHTPIGSHLSGKNTNAE